MSCININFYHEAIGFRFNLLLDTPGFPAFLSLFLSKVLWDSDILGISREAPLAQRSFLRNKVFFSSRFWFNRVKENP